MGVALVIPLGHFEHCAQLRFGLGFQSYNVSKAFRVSSSSAENDQRGSNKISMQTGFESQEISFAREALW